MAPVRGYTLVYHPASLMALAVDLMRDPKKGKAAFIKPHCN